MPKPILFFLIAFLAITFISCTKDNDAPENKVPVANAGASQAIVLHVDSVTLTGSGTDGDGNVVSYLWSQVSGPAATIIVNPGSPTTKIKGFVQGSYIFQLMVTDNKGATGVDTAMVTVAPALQVTFTSQPANNPNEIGLVYDNGIDESGNRPDLPIEAWTSGGGTFTVRGLVKFDLSSIPATATIVSANLYLYSYPSPTLNGNFTDANFGTNNVLLVKQVTAAWTPVATTWVNQPATTTTNEVIVPQANQPIQDLNLDVTSMVSSMISSNTNYGFLLQLQTEATYNSRIFVASFNTTYTANKFPKLVVVYQ